MGGGGARGTLKVRPGAIARAFEHVLACAGGLVLVTHDSRLIRDTCNQVLVVSDGKVAVEKGGFDDYKKRLIDEMERYTADSCRCDSPPYIV